MGTSARDYVCGVLQRLEVEDAYNRVRNELSLTQEQMDQLTANGRMYERILRDARELLAEEAKKASSNGSAERDIEREQAALAGSKGRYLEPHQQYALPG